MDRTFPIASLARRALAFGLALALVPARANADGELVGFVLGAGTGDADTTTLREEFKVTVPAKEARRFRERLQAIGGNSFSLRDAQPADGRNVTSTRYLDVDSSTLAEVVGLPRDRPDISISPKIRFRKYEVALANGRRRESNPGLTWIEIKLPHPNIPGVTLKPRILATDDAARRLRRPEVLDDPARRAALRADLIAAATSAGPVTPRTTAEIDHFLDVFAGLYRRDAAVIGRGGRIATEVNIRYQRKAYELPVEIEGRTLKLQFTFDEAIEFQDPRTAKARGIRGAPEIVEIKIPLPQAKMSRAELKGALLGLARRRRAEAPKATAAELAAIDRSIAGYQTILKIRDYQQHRLEPRQVRSFAAWKGKHHTFRHLPDELEAVGRANPRFRPRGVTLGANPRTAGRVRPLPRTIRRR